MKQPEWQREGICGALSSTSQQLNLEPSEQRERMRNEEVIADVGYTLIRVCLLDCSLDTIEIKNYVVDA